MLPADDPVEIPESCKKTSASTVTCRYTMPTVESAHRGALQPATIHLAGDTFPEPPTVVELPEHVARVLNRD